MCLFETNITDMMKERTFVSFDWALKRILRDKANFGSLFFLSTIFSALYSPHLPHPSR